MKEIKNYFWSMMHTAKYIEWIDVLRYFERNGYVHNGLTLPFLIGSRTVLQPGKRLLSIKEFLEEANSTSMSYPITLMKCDHIGEYVFETMDSETNAVRYKGLYKEFDNLTITDGSFKDCNSLNEIVLTLESSYGSCMKDGCYSMLSGEWKPFSNQDLSQLKELL